MGPWFSFFRLAQSFIDVPIEGQPAKRIWEVTMAAAASVEPAPTGQAELASRSLIRSAMPHGRAVSEHPRSCAPL